MGAGVLKGKKADGGEDPEAKQARDWLQKTLDASDDQKVMEALGDISEEGLAKLARALTAPKDPAKAAASFRMLAVPASIRKSSVNKGLLHCAEEWAKENGVDFVWADTKSLPLFDADEVEGCADSVKTFWAELEKADAILFGCCEHNYSMSAALKNALDWGSRGKTWSGAHLWKGKVAGIVGAAGPQGSARGQLALRQSGVFLDIRFVNSPEVCVRAFEGDPKPFDMATGDVVSEEVKQKVHDMTSRTRALALESKAGAALPKGAFRRGSFLSGAEAPKVEKKE